MTHPWEVCSTMCLRTRAPSWCGDPREKTLGPSAWTAVEGVSKIDGYQVLGPGPMLSPKRKVLCLTSLLSPYLIRRRLLAEGRIWAQGTDSP